MTEREKNTNTPQRVLKQLPKKPIALEVESSEDASGASYFVKGAIFALGGKARITIEPML